MPGTYSILNDEGKVTTAAISKSISIKSVRATDRAVIQAGFVVTGGAALSLSQIVLDGNKTVSFAVVFAGEHRTTRNKYGGKIKPAGSQKHTRGNLVAVGDENHSVKRMSCKHNLDRIRDKLTGTKAVLHTLVVHSKSVANTDGVELKRNAARVADTVHNLFGNVV